MRDGTREARSLLGKLPSARRRQGKPLEAQGKQEWLLPRGLGRPRERGAFDPHARAIKAGRSAQDKSPRLDSIAMRAPNPAKPGRNVSRPYKGRKLGAEEDGFTLEHFDGQEERDGGVHA